MSSPIRMFAPLVAALVILVACLGGCPNVPPDMTNSPKGCENVAKLQWMKSSATYTSDNVAKLAATFKVAAQADAEHIRALKDASGNVEVAPDFSHVSHKTQEVSGEVSPEFYEKATKYALATCNAQNLLSIPGGLSEAQRNQVVQTLIDLSNDFGGIAEKEQKKN